MTVCRAPPQSQNWAMLIKRVFEVDPLLCLKCGGQMKVVTFIEPPQADVIEKILCHCGLWRCSAARPPLTDGKGDGVDDAGRPDAKSLELTYIDIDTFPANF